MNISIDVGFGFTKVKFKKKLESFPSVVGSVRETDLNFLNDQYGVQEDYMVSIKESGIEKSYYVGNLAMINRVERNWNADRTIDDDILKTLVLTAIAAVKASGELEVSVGLPIAIYNEQRDRVESILYGVEAEVSLNSEKHKKIKISKVNVLVQGLGACIDLITTKQENLPNFFAVIDVGYRTVDYLVVKMTSKGQTIVGRFSGTLSEEGMNVAFNLAIEKLKAKGIKISYADFEKAVINQEYEVFHKDGKINIKDDVQEEFKMLAERIKDKLNVKWKEISEELAKVFITGGGSRDLFSYLNKYYTNAELQESSQYANVSGYDILSKQED